MPNALLNESAARDGPPWGPPNLDCERVAFDDAAAQPLFAEDRRDYAFPGDARLVGASGVPGVLQQPGGRGGGARLLPGSIGSRHGATDPPDADRAPCRRCALNGKASVSQVRQRFLAGAPVGQCHR